MYVDTDDANDLTVGSRIHFKCNIEDFKDEYAHYSYAKGLSGSCNNVEELTVTDSEGFVPEAIFSHIRELIARHAKMLSDSDAGSMFAALLLGERDMLSEEVQLDFRRLGITHLLALSGLHLAILSFALEKLFRLLGVKKNIRIVSTISFTLLYMTITGFPVSVMRAGIMLILSNLLALVFRESDSVTSLLIAVALICIISPYAIYDISLWLSAFATLGIIVFSELSGEIKESKKGKSKLFSYLGSSLMISAFAISATMFITQFTFNGISLISPIATLIFSIFVELIMYLGVAMLIIGWLIPIGLLLSPIVKITTSLASFMSSFDIFVSKDYNFVNLLVIILSVLFLLFIILDIKNKKNFALTIVGLLAIVYISCAVMHLVTKCDDKVIYYSQDKQDIILIKSDKETALLSLATYTSTTGYDATDILIKEDIFSLDKYIASHYSWKLSEELDVLLSNIPISNIYLPKPSNEDEKAILNKIEAVTNSYTTEIREFNLNETVAAGDYKLRMLYTVPYGEDTAQSVFMLYGNEEKIAYISSGVLNGKGRTEAYDAMSQATEIILGRHGKSYKYPSYFTAELKSARNIILSSKNLLMPSYTTYYYIKNGCEIHSHPKEFILED